MEYDRIKSRDMAAITAEEIEIPEIAPQPERKRIGFCTGKMIHNTLNLPVLRDSGRVMLTMRREIGSILL